MITTQINGITLTENAIEVIHRIQDCEHDWMKRSLEEAMDGSLKILKPDGKILAISYHSLEDRIVKTRFRKWEEEGLGKARPRKAIAPTECEIENNYKSRSAKLRIFVLERDNSKKGDKADALHRIPT